MVQVTFLLPTKHIADNIRPVHPDQALVEEAEHPYLPMPLKLSLASHCDCGPVCNDEQHLLVVCPRHELHVAAIEYGRRTSGLRARLMRWSGRAA